ncbi:MFS transporter [Amycolatopsis taiwanensis]|uniref:MFS transporter n=1 Tax=Amycolatopsis taiwanensis TaxID=342230 RepID=A0A9W6R996_9PSEU|nr:MFS transporter [Amycolatopsis taiwanensis]GLY71704.1 MFS transporter [Amycolatopsis taiwanensis]
MAESMPAVPREQSGRSRPLWREPGVWQLLTVTALGFTSFFLTLGSVPLWAVRGGASDASAGSVTAVMLGFTVLIQTMVPALQRRVGSATLLALGLLALGAPAPFYLLGDHLPGLIAVSAIRGVGFGLLTVVAARLVSQVAPSNRQGKAVGLYGLAIAVPNLLAVPAGAALTSSNHFFWVAVLAACPVLAIPLVRVFRGSDSTAVSSGESGKASPHTSRAPARHGVAGAVRVAIVPSVVLLVVTLSGGGLVTFLPIALSDGQLASITLLVFGITGTLGRWQAGMINDRIGMRLLLPAALVASALGLAAVAAALPGSGDGNAGTIWTVAMLAGAAIFGAGYGATQNLTQIAVFARAGERHAVTASAVWNIFFDAGTAIGSYGVGLVAATGLHLTGTFVVCAVLVAAAVPAAIAAGTRG